MTEDEQDRIAADTALAEPGATPLDEVRADLNRSNGGWRSRIVGEGEEAPDQLLANPMNWRIHPKSQRDLLENVLDTVGWVQRVIVNQRTGHVVDGHLRIESALSRGEAVVPVLYIDVSPEEEQAILATYDPLSALAGTDDEKVAELRDMLKLTMPDLRNAAVEAGIAALEDPPPADHGLLGILDVALRDPTHTAQVGETWRLGAHVLLIADVLTGWAAWTPYLDADAVFAPYPGPFVVLSQIASRRPLVLVQPDPYIAAHILDAWAAVHPDTPPTQVS
jgi:hypothetical protein